MTEKRDVIHIVCTGTTLTSKNKRGIKYIQVTQEDIDNAVIQLTGREWVFGYNRDFNRVDVIGGIYRVEAMNNSVYLGTAQYHGRWANKDDLLEWDTRSRLCQTELDAESKLKKLRAENHLKNTLETLRQMYWDLPAPRRLAFLTSIIYYISGIKS